MLSIEQLIDEKNILEADVEKMSSQIRKFEIDLNQMKANYNAVDGALQLARKLIAKARQNEEVKSNDKLEIKEKK